MVTFSSQYTKQYYSRLAVFSVLYSNQHTKHHKLQYKNQIPGVDAYKTAYVTIKR
jgi:hypothetical protein